MRVGYNRCIRRGSPLHHIPRWVTTAPQRPGGSEWCQIDAVLHRRMLHRMELGTRAMSQQAAAGRRSILLDGSLMMIPACGLPRCPQIPGVDRPPALLLGTTPTPGLAIRRATPQARSLVLRYAATTENFLLQGQVLVFEFSCSIMPRPFEFAKWTESRPCCQA